MPVVMPEDMSDDNVSEVMSDDNLSEGMSDDDLSEEHTQLMLDYYKHHSNDWGPSYWKSIFSGYGLSTVGGSSALDIKHSIYTPAERQANRNSYCGDMFSQRNSQKMTVGELYDPASEQAEEIKIELRLYKIYGRRVYIVPFKTRFVNNIINKKQVNVKQEPLLAYMFKEFEKTYKHKGKYRKSNKIMNRNKNSGRKNYKNKIIYKNRKNYRNINRYRNTYRHRDRN